MASEWQKLRKQLEAQGFTCEQRRSTHWLVRDRDGRTVTTLAATPSDHRAMKNALAALKRAGFDSNKK